MTKEFKIILSALASFFCFIIISMFLILQGHQEWRLLLLSEDKWLEWFGFLMLSFGFWGLLLLFPLRIKACAGQPIMLHFGFVGFIFLYALGALEEISWFQRILNIESSIFFTEHNRQQEINLHNLTIGNVSINRDILAKLIAIFSLIFNIILPLAAYFKPKIKDFVEKWGFFIPPLSLAILYVVSAIFIAVIGDSEDRVGELLEAIGIFYYVLLCLGAYGAGVNYSKPAIQTTSARYGFIYGIMGATAFLFFIAWIMAHLSL